MSWATPTKFVKRSSAVIPNASRCQRKKLSAGRWLVARPLGTPVEPEVNRM
jgi:hypothetical protein